MTGCAQTGVPLPPSLELPSPVNNLRAVRKADKVYLSWAMPSRTSDDDAIHQLGPTHVCRSVSPQFESCGTPVGEIQPATVPAAANAAAPQKPTLNYTDTLPAQLTAATPEGIAYYAVEVLNSHGRSAGLSNRVEIPLLPTLPPPPDFRAQVTADGIRASWSCVTVPADTPATLLYRVRVYRLAESGAKAEVAAEAPISTCPGSLLDQSFEWEKTYQYWATIVTISTAPGKPEAQVEGDNTPEVRLVAHDTFPPSVPSGLQAVFSGAGQKPFVDLIWSPGTGADLAGYNVYRHEEGHSPVKINSDLVKTPAYRDSEVEPGRRYFYSVSAVDLRGNESARSDEASEEVPQ